MNCCPICRSSSSQPFIDARDHASGDWFALVLCADCGVVYVAPIPDDLGRYYHVSYRRYGSWIQKLFALLYRRHGRAFARSFDQPGRALEIGCGEGWMLQSLQRAGWRIVGTERSTESAGFAAHGLSLPVVVGGLDAFASVPTFDLILMHHVLEHLPDPMKWLQQCAELLRPGGTVVIVVPNLRSWQFSMAGRNWFHLDVPRHLTHFTPATMENALRKVGLRTRSIRYTSWSQDPFGWMVSFLNILGFPQTRWLHWLTGNHRDFTLVHTLMILLSPPLLAMGMILAPISWLCHRGACMEIRATK